MGRQHTHFSLGNKAKRPGNLPQGKAVGQDEWDPTMGNTTSHRNDPALKVLKYMLLSQGLKLSDHIVIQAWEDILTLAPYPLGIFFSWDM